MICDKCSLDNAALSVVSGACFQLPVQGLSRQAVRTLCRDQRVKEVACCCHIAPTKVISHWRTPAHSVLFWSVADLMDKGLPGSIGRLRRASVHSFSSRWHRSAPSRLSHSVKQCASTPLEFRIAERHSDIDPCPIRLLTTFYFHVARIASRNRHIASHPPS